MTRPVANFAKGSIREVFTVIVPTMLGSSFSSQNRNSLLNLTTKPRFRRSQPLSGRKPPVTS